jgi:hypothetical protein
VARYKELETLQGKSIPKFYGFFNLHGILILAMEDCGHPLKVDEFPALKSRILLAVSAFNEKQVKHNDLEIRETNGLQVYPNILVKDGEIRIIVTSSHENIKLKYG